MIELKLLSLELPPASHVPGWYPAFITCAGDEGSETLPMAVEWTGCAWRGIDPELGCFIFWIPDYWQSSETAISRAAGIVASGEFYYLDIVDAGN